MTTTLATEPTTVTVYSDLEQGTEEWFAIRRGMVTASVVGSLISVGSPDPLMVECFTCEAPAGSPCLSAARKVPTPIKTFHDARASLASDLPPTLGVASNETSRSLTALLVAERITGWTDPTYTSNDMLRGRVDEALARDLYSKTYAEVTEVGFIVREGAGIRIGYSPDGLVGDDGLIECKSRRARKHIATIIADEVPAENMAQIQGGLLVSGRSWCDYLSYCGGLPMWRKRVFPDPAWHAAIIAAVEAFEESAAIMTAAYLTAVEGLPTTERISYDFDEIEV